MGKWGHSPFPSKWGVSPFPLQSRPMNKNTWVLAAAAVVVGIALRFVVNLQPLWWLAWFAPGLLLAIALRSEGWTSRGLVALAALIGLTSNVPYYLKVMPLLPVILVTTLQVLLWVFVVGATRRVIRAFDSGWTVLAYPAIWVAVDTLLAHFTPDGNWGSLAYTQADVLPVAQLASVFGVGGVLFLLMSFNAALALAIHRGLAAPGSSLAYGATVAAVIASVAFGVWRL